MDSSLRRQSTLTLDSSNERQSSVRSQSSVRKQSSVKSTTSIVKQTTVKTTSIVKGASVQSKNSVRKQASMSQAGSVQKQASLQKQASKAGGRPRREIHKVIRFQFTEPSDEEKAKRVSPKDKVLVFHKGQVVAVRNDTGGFYLCMTDQLVYQTSEKFKIRWLSKVAEPDTYKKDFADYTELDCVVTNVHLTREKGGLLKLLPAERARVERTLKKVLEGDDDDLDLFEEVGKKRKVPSPSKATKKQRTASPRRSPASKTKGKKEKGEKAKKEKKKKEPKARKVRGLVPNPDIKVLDKDPLFEGREELPFVAPNIHSKLIYRALNLNDTKLLKKLIDDVDHINQVESQRAVYIKDSPIKKAIRNDDFKSLELLLNEEYHRVNRKPRCRQPRSLLQHQGTGKYNYRSLGIHRIRNISMSRGSKEGNNALTKDQDDKYFDSDDHIREALTNGASMKTMNLLIEKLDLDDDKMEVRDKIYLAVRFGNRKLAGSLMEDYEKFGGTPFNFLHKEVLLFDNEDLRKLREVSVKKKCWDKKNQQITPIHCACINPNVKYLTALGAILPDYNVMDKELRRPIHYAAACTGTGPLEFLLKRGVNAEEADSQGVTALMIAALCNRVDNVDFLLTKAKAEAEQQKADLAEQEKDEEEDEEEEDEEEAGSKKQKTVDQSAIDKWGIGGINRPDKRGKAALHHACNKGYIGVVRALIKHGADINLMLPASWNKITPIIVACDNGHLDIVKLLVAHGVQADQKDKLKRTPLMHAVMNGHTHIASYLLNLGANPNQADTSGNTCVHYSVAYGWYFCIKLLIKAGADANKPNDWKITPLGVAFLKGLMGLADVLLEQEGVDINFRDDRGMTLLAIGCSSALEEGLSDQIKYLIEKKGADPLLKDVNDNTMLHIVAGNEVKTAGSYYNRTVCPTSMERSVKLAEILIKHGVDPSAQNSSGQTAVMIALEMNNEDLVKYLVKQGGGITDTVNEAGYNVLHLMAKQCCGYKLLALTDILTKQKAKTGGQSIINMLKSMVNNTDKEGYSPLLLACKVYRDWRRTQGFNEGWEKIDQEWQDARDFFKFLIEQCEADTDAVVEKKHFEGIVPEKEKDQYTDDGKCNVVHFLSQCKNERALYKNGIHKGDYPALDMILRYKPDLNVYNIQGRTPLLQAISDSSNHKADKLMQVGANVNLRSKDERTDGFCSPLLMASKNRNLFLVGKLLAKKADTKVVDHLTRNGCLHYLVQDTGTDKYELVQTIGKMIKDGKADVNARNNRDRTPLHLAVNANSGSANASSEVEEFLIDNGADVFLKDIRGRIPIHYAFVKIGGHSVRSSVDPVELATTLTAAMKGKMIDLADNYGQTVLHLAANRGASVCSMHLLQKSAKIDFKDNIGNTPLGNAVLASHESCAIMLMQKGANINVSVIEETNTKTTDTRKKPSWEWLPEKKPEEDSVSECPVFQKVVEKGWAGVTCMMLDVLDNFGVEYARTVEAALITNKFNLALTLIRKQKNHNKLKVCNKKGQNLFHSLALQTDPGTDTALQIRVAESLRNVGVNMNAKDKYGCTPLIYAALKQHATVGKFILDNAKALDTEETDGFGRTAMAAAFWSGKEASYFCALLTGQGAEIDILCDYPTHKVPTFDKSVENQATTYWNKTGNSKVSPLIFAIHNRNYRTVETVLGQRADVNTTDEFKRTPLMHAVRQNEIRIVRLLLDNSYDHNDYETKLNEELRKAAEAIDEKREAKLKKQSSKRGFTLGQAFLKQAKRKDQDEDEESEEEEEMETDVPVDKLDNFVVFEDPEEVKLDYKKFTKKGKVNLKAQDKNGWTVLHHLACSLPLGTYDNVQMLKLLVDCGAQLGQTNKSGQTPLDFALDYGAHKLALAMQKLQGVNKKNWQVPEYGVPDVTDGINWPGRLPDYKSDAEALLRDQELEMDTDDVEDETKEWPDSRLNLDKDTAEVFMDSEQDIPYSVLLTKIDVGKGSWGLFNFYKMQVIYQKGKDMYILFNRWGRIGDEGQYQKTPYSTAAEVVKEFCKVFRAKTGNWWKDFKSFENHPNKYRLVQKDEQLCAKQLKDVEFKLESKHASKLHPYVQDMIKEFSDTKTFDQAMRRAGLDPSLMPFGKIKKEAITRAKEILKKIKPIVENIEKHREKRPIEDPEAYRECVEKVSNLSNEYFHLLPCKGYEFEKIRPIDSEDSLKKEFDKVANLVEMEIASRIMAGAQYRVRDMNPLDYIYRSLKCEIQLLNEEDLEAQYILRYATNTMRRGRWGAELKAVYKISREGEDERLEQCGIGNRKLLFHGSSTSNLISILSRGLLVAPSEAPTTGYAWGKGIYTADKFSKSESYCYNWSSSSNVKFMLVCEVALGKACGFFSPEYMEKPKAGFDSTVAFARDQPLSEYDVVMPTGSQLPVGEITRRNVFGKLMNQARMSCNEYVVYKESQVALRYILQFE